MIETLWANLGEGFKFEIAGVRDKRVLHSCVRCSTVVLSLIYFFHEIFQTTSIYHNYTHGITLHDNGHTMAWKSGARAKYVHHAHKCEDMVLF